MVAIYNRLLLRKKGYKYVKNMLEKTTEYISQNLKNNSSQVEGKSLKHAK